MMRALVTGAGKRLGRAMALYLADRGFDVAVHFASSETAAQSLVQELIAKGRQSIALQADLLKEDQVETLTDRAVDGLEGNLTCLINNASIFEYDTLESATRRSWDRHIESNLRAPNVFGLCIKWRP